MSTAVVSSTASSTAAVSSTVAVTEAVVGSPEWVALHSLSSVATNRRAQLELGRSDERFFSIEGDLGDFFGFPFRDEFPARFLDFGIAEASLMGAAAGLALRGKTPLVNTFALFALMRSAEQVRLDVCYHDLDVKIFGTFCGMQSPYSGTTHHAIEDIAFARALPNMVVLAPADAVATYWATLLAGAHRGPVYVRLGVDVTPQVYGEEARFAIGKGVVLRPGRDLTLVAAGLSVVAETLRAAERLAEAGIEARVVDLFSIKPIDRELLIEAAEQTGLVITVEEHSIFGGVGGAVAEVLAEARPVPLRILGVPDRYVETLRTHAELLEGWGLSAGAIAETARRELARLRAAKGGRS